MATNPHHRNEPAFRPWRVWTGAALLAAVFTGCAVGPDYQRPAATATTPATFSSPTNGWKTAEPQAHLPRGAWWEIFGDAELSKLVTQAGEANQDLKAALARFEQARATANVAKSAYYPNVDFSPSASRTRSSANRPVDGVSTHRSETYNTFTVPLDAGYEVDLWGRVRHTVEAARARQDANAADLESVKLSIQAEVATDYLTLRSLDSESALLATSVDSLRKALELTRNRRAGGIATDLDVSQAETLLKSTEAQIPSVALQRARLEHALAVLAGQPAPTFQIAVRPLNFNAPSVPVGLPSELLERRPDIATAERLMAAANADVGVAKGAFYPSIRFDGLAGFQSVSAGTIFNWPSRMWAVGPSLSLPVFDAGRNRANLQASKAAYDETVARYRQSVLTAFAEVEDSLAAQHLLATQQEAQAAASDAAKHTLAIATNRYKSGLVTYLEVSTAQTAAIDLERQVVRLQGQQLVAAVALVKSLGGGWENPAPQKTATR